MIINNWSIDRRRERRARWTSIILYTAAFGYFGAHLIGYFIYFY